MKTLGITIGMALAAGVAWLVVSGRAGVRQPDAASVVSTADAYSRGTDVQPAARSGIDRDAARTPAERATALRPSAGVTPELPLREAIDSGRAQPVFMSLTAPPKVRAGARFSAVVNVETENDVARIIFTLRFDPARLRIVAVDPGDFMSHAGAKSRMTFAADEGHGRLSVELAEDRDGPPVSGGGSVVNVRFEALKRGVGELALSEAAMSDLNNEGVASVLPVPLAMEVDE